MFTNPCNINYTLERMNDYTKPQKNISVGDIIVFRLDTKTRFLTGLKTSTIYHRVTQVTDKGYITKGDLNDYEDWFIVPRHWVVWRMLV